jgi:hypothetical protein
MASGASGSVGVIHELGKAKVDEVLVGRLKCGVLVASDVDPGQGVAGHLGSRVRRQRWAVREFLASTESSHELLLGGCQRVGSDGCDAPPVRQDRVGVAQIQGGGRLGQCGPVLLLKRLRLGR